MKKINKKDILVICCISLFSLIMCHVFLKVRYSSDSYCLMYRGYFEYPKNYFLIDGRIIAAIICYVAGFFNLKYNTYFILMDFIGIQILSISVFILYKYFLKILKIEKIIYKILLLLSVYITAFNYISIEYLLYPESGVMCLGVLFCIIASIFYNESSNKKYLGTFLMVFMVSICYQGIVNLFPILSYSIYIIKKYNKSIEKNNIKNRLKENIIEIIKLGIIFCFVLIISFGICLLGEKIIGKSNWHLRSFNFIVIKDYLQEGIIDNFYIFPRYLNYIIILVTFFIILQYSRNKFLSIEYIFICVLSYIFVFLPIIIWGYIMARMSISVGAILGISLIFCILSIIQSENKNFFRDITIVLFIIVFFIFNTINFIINENEHYKAYLKDVEFGERLNKKIIEYEKNNGIIIKKMEYGYDKNPTFYTEGIKTKGPLTERKFSLFYCIVEATNFYCNKNFELKDQDILSDYICNKYFYGIQYDYYSDTQILFEGDTLYLLIY